MRTRIIARKRWRLHGTEELEFPHFMCEDFDQKTSFLPNERFSRVFSIPCCMAILSKCIGLAVSACGAGYTKTWKTVGSWWNVYFFRLKRFRNQAKKLGKIEQNRAKQSNKNSIITAILQLLAFAYVIFSKNHFSPVFALFWWSWASSDQSPTKKLWTKKMELSTSKLFQLCRWWFLIR